MKCRVTLLTVLLTGFCCVSLSAGIRPENIAVVVNSNLPMSQAVGNYYCQQRGIPSQNLLEIDVSAQDSISQAEYATLAQNIRDRLTAPPLNINPNDWANDPIQVLVMCYGVPSRILGSSNSVTINHTAVDSYLTLLFSSYAGPDVIDGDYSWPRGLSNPYYSQDQDFATFRAWASNSVSAFGHTYKMRYLVCRLDAYDDITVNAPGFGDMPRDVKNMIDRASTSVGQSGKFILDEPWWSDSGWGHNRYSDAESQLQTLVDPSVVIRDGSASATYLNESDVMGYASFGVHDLDIMMGTDWARPHFAWKPGAVAVINESAGGQAVRYPRHSYGCFILNPSDPANPRTLSLDQPVMRVRVDYTVGSTAKHFQNYRVALLNYSNVILKSALVGADGIAEIDLTDPAIQWGDHRTKVWVYYPDNDGGYHGGQYLKWSELVFSPADLLWTEQGQGDGRYASVYLARQCSSEFIRDGCSGVNAAVSEPGADFVNANTTLPRYAKGYTWAEAAYMGTANLGFKALILGDPLMAPYGCMTSVKRKNDGVCVTTSPVVATVASGVVGANLCYVQSQDRVTGIRVQTADTVTEGDLVCVTGTLSTNANGERTITSATVRSLGAGTSAKPLEVVNRALGGGGWNYSLTTGAGQQGMTGRAGLNNIGLLLRTTGCVSDSDSNAKTLNIDDGSLLGPIKVAAPSTVTVPADGTYVGVTGVSSCEVQSGDIVPVLLTRRQDDIREYGECEACDSGSRGNAPTRPQPEEPIGGPTDTVAWALGQGDGTTVTVKACGVLESSGSGLVIRDGWISGAASIRVSGSWAVGVWSTVDVTGTITMLSDGTRAIMAAQVLVYTDPNGKPFTFPIPWLRGSAGRLIEDWPYKQAATRRTGSG
jgi:uncharacterized protein (TIGR03790 family)